MMGAEPRGSQPIVVPANLASAALASAELGAQRQGVTLPN
jgi:hypothetical protein